MKKLKSGFTLVELVVVTILMGIIMTALVIILRPSQKYYKNITNKAFEELACITAMDVVDGELRYATNMKIVYTDSAGKTSGGVDVASTIDVSKLPNYIKFDNGHRETIGRFNARGYINKGKTADMKPVSSTLNKGLFSDYDYQFELSGINTTKTKQSLTVSITATPMLVTSNNVELDVDHEHTFDETFKLINMRHAADVGGKMGGLEVPIDETVPSGGIIWIFYAKPVDVISNGGVNPGPGLTDADLNPGTYTEIMPIFTLKDENDVDYNRIYFVSDPLVHTTDSTMFSMNGSNTDGVSLEKYVKDSSSPSGYKKYNSAMDQVYASNYIDIYWGDNTTATYTIKSSYGTYKKSASSPMDNNKILCNITRADFSDSAVKYFYFADEFVPEGSLPNNSLFLHNTWDPSNPELGDPDLKAKTKTIHYVHRLGDTVNGVRIEKETTGTKSSVSGATGFVSCTSTTNISVVLKGTDTDKASAKIYKGNTSAADDLLYTFTLDADNKDEIWVCNGVLYESEADIPADPEPIIVHYLYSEQDPYATIKAKTNNPGFAEMNSSPLSGEYNSLNLDSNKDIEFVMADDTLLYCLLTNYDGVDCNIAVNNTAGAPLFGASNDLNPKEYWLYKGILYDSEEAIPEDSYLITVHYKYWPGENYTGLKFADVDGKPGIFAQLNGSDLVDRTNTNTWEGDTQNTFIAHGNADFDCTIKLRNNTAAVAILMATTNNNGSAIITLTHSSPSEIWICDGKWYENPNDLPEIPSGDPGTGSGDEPPVVSFNIENLTATATNFNTGWDSDKGGHFDLVIKGTVTGGYIPMSKGYVIKLEFDRAVTVHQASNITVEGNGTNVIYLTPTMYSDISEGSEISLTINLFDVEAKCTAISLA